MKNMGMDVVNVSISSFSILMIVVMMMKGL